MDAETKAKVKEAIKVSKAELKDKKALVKSCQDAVSKAIETGKPRRTVKLLRDKLAKAEHRVANAELKIAKAEKAVK